MAPAEEGAPATTPTGLPGLTPVRESPPLVSLPLPNDATAKGRLVSGFPSFLRPPAGSSIATSSVSADQGRLQVALVGTTALSPEQLLRAYRTRLSSRGLDEQTSPTVPGATAAAFVRGDSSVSVTMTVEGTRTTYSVYGALRAGKA